MAISILALRLIVLYLSDIRYYKVTQPHSLTHWPADSLVDTLIGPTSMIQMLKFKLLISVIQEKYENLKILNGFQDQFSEVQHGLYFGL